VSKGRLFVISGASGVGKSTVLKLVLAARKDITFSVSATTRKPRKGEVEGESYYFVSHEQFRSMIENDEFVEYDDHMKNFYGTPRGQLEDKLEKCDVFLDIEPNGAFNVRAQRPDAILIFIAPPSYEELERRLRSRGDTNEDQITVRLERARWEMEQSKQYDYIVINDRVETCAKQIINIITNHK
jgi:guanylate kinase